MSPHPSDQASLQFVIWPGHFAIGQELRIYIRPISLFRPFGFIRRVPGKFDPTPEGSSHPFENWLVSSVRIGLNEQMVTNGKTTDGKTPLATLLSAPPFRMMAAQPGMDVSVTLWCCEEYTDDCPRSFYMLGKGESVHFD